MPARRLCDLCKNDIDTSRAYPVLSYPLDPQDLRVLEPRIEASPGEVLGLSRLLGGRPALYQFEFCRDCIDGILPMLSDLKSEYVRRLVDERDRRAKELA